MVLEVIECPWCGASIGPHWEVFEHTACQRPAPEPLPTAWEVEKARNRLARMVEKVGRGMLRPKLSAVLTGEATTELHSARALLAEADQLLGERRSTTWNTKSC